MGDLLGLSRDVVGVLSAMHRTCDIRRDMERARSLSRVQRQPEGEMSQPGMPAGACVGAGLGVLALKALRHDSWGGKIDDDQGFLEAAL